MDRVSVLVVDDEEAVRTPLVEFLGDAGHRVQAASGGLQALQILESDPVDVVLLDMVMPDLGGLEVLKRYRAAGGRAPVIVLSALTGAEGALRAMQLGATDYLAKPYEIGELEDVLRRALGTGPSLSAVDPPELRVEASRLGEEAADVSLEPQLVAESPPMRRVSALIERIADSEEPVLIVGESGTGKEVIAQTMHRRGTRRSGPFIRINCAALPAELLESELFGHQRGAFTGSTSEKPGKLELAAGGTLFLDEVDELPVRLQAKLLQVLQDKVSLRVGAELARSVDARVIVATHRDLEREIELGHFREDLYYRLNVLAIRVPPLRDRREDLPALVEHFLQRHGRPHGLTLADLPPEVMRKFDAYDWPGNVRELENMVRRLVVLQEPSLVLDELRPHLRWEAAGDWPDGAQPPPPPSRIPESEMSLKDIGKRAAMLAEREAILAMLQRTGWNKRKAAGRLRISYKALLYKIKEAGIVDPRTTAELG